MTKLQFLEQEVMIFENERIVSIPYTEIKTIVCDKPYILIETTQRKCKIEYTLKGFCNGLPPFIMQCNKSTYINLLLVSSIHKNMGKHEACIDKVTFPVARRRIDEIRNCYIQFKTRHSSTESCHTCKNCRVVV